MSEIEKRNPLILVTSSGSIENELRSHTKPSSEILDDGISTESDSTSITRTTIIDLPLELLENIMIFLDQVSATVFGLTCHKVYNEFKRQYANADPLSLETYVWKIEDDQHPQFQKSIQLNHLLRRWIGSGDTKKYLYFRDLSLQYTKASNTSAGSSHTGGQFLLRSIYRKGFRRSDHALKQLLVAWRAYNTIENWKPRVSVNESNPTDELPQYPSPFNMSGQGWLDEMQRILAVHHPNPESPFRVLILNAIMHTNRHYEGLWSEIKARKNIF